MHYYNQCNEEHFGKAVSISNNRAIIGAPENDFNPDYPNHGRVYFFHRSGSNWIPDGSVCGYAEELMTNDNFGRDISMSGDYSVIAAESGAYIFKYTNAWNLQTNLRSSGAREVSISGNYVVLNGDNGYHNRVFLYERNTITDTWSQIAELSPSEWDPFFGNDVSISGPNICVGGENCTYFYIKPINGWIDMTEDYKINTSQFCSSVSNHNFLTITGAIGYNTAGGAYIEEVELCTVSGHVSLDGGSGDITNVLIKFDPQNSNSNIYLNPDGNGNFSHVFYNDEFDNYVVTYSLDDYYPAQPINIQINGNTSPLQLPDFILYPILSNDLVIVSTDQQNPQAFHNIKDAVYYLEDNGGGTVNVLPGIYTGSENSGIWWIPWDIENNEEIHIKIKGLPASEQCIIDCGVTFVTFDDDGFSGYGWGNGYNYADVIENLTIKNASCGIIIENGSPIIRNNIIEDCYKHTTYNPGDILGVGISCKSSATIENNIFQNNEGYAHHDLSISYGGGI
ncbi:MAG: FG-GAP repeat protein, partial [Desulfobacula sp.]|nr:FG-GAP repeat protein [Desulfobacula sp.]